MLPHRGYRLNVTAIKITRQPTNDQCIIDCMNTTNCWSINAVEQLDVDDVECQLLATNKHRNSTEYVAQTGSTHFFIPVSCLDIYLRRFHSGFHPLQF